MFDANNIFYKTLSVSCKALLPAAVWPKIASAKNIHKNIFSLKSAENKNTQHGTEKTYFYKTKKKMSAGIAWILLDVGYTR